jgi:hypothetical protein
LSYVEKHLIPGETVQYQTQLHWIVVLGHLLAATALELLALLFLIALFSKPSGVGVAPPRTVIYLGALLFFVLGGIFFAIGLLKRNATEMAVTNKRVIAKTGIAERRTIELLLHGTGGTPEIFEKIQHPLKFREQVQSQIAGDVKSS